MNDRTWPPSGDRLLGEEPGEPREPGEPAERGEPGEPGFGRVLPGPWPAHPGRALHPGDAGGVVEADFVARADEHWFGIDDIDVFDDARRVPPADPRSPFTPRAPFPSRPVTQVTTAPRGVPSQSTQGTPPGGWPALGSPANAPARPQTWPGAHPTGPHPTGKHPAGIRPGRHPAGSRVWNGIPPIRPAMPAFPDLLPPPPPPAAPRRARRHLVGYPVVIATSLALGIAIAGGTPFGAAGTPVATVPSARTTDGVATTGSTARNGVHPFGETVRFADGSTLTTGAPTPFTPTDVAFGGADFAHHVKVKVTFVNNSDKVFDPSRSVGSVTSGDREGRRVHQPAFDPPDNAILPGKRVTWWLGFGVADPAHVTLTVRMGFLDYDDVILTNET